MLLLVIPAKAGIQLLETGDLVGHGPGDEPMPELSPQQTDWAIEFCMSWTKSLIKQL